MSTSKNPADRSNSGHNSSGPTHQKRLARAFAEASGRPYAQCLEIVRRAHAAGRLPTPLDDEGIKKGVELLMQIEPPALDLPSTSESAAAPEPLDPWTLSPSFGTLLDGGRAELGDHLLVVGMTGQGKSVALNHLAVDALRLGWAVEWADATKGGSLYPELEVLSTGGRFYASRTLDEIEQRLGLYQDELVETHRLMTENDVDHPSALPEDARGVPTLIVIDEWLPITANERIARVVSRLVATGRSAGIHVVLSSQDAWSSGWDPGMKANMDRLVIGRAPLGAVAVTYQNPDAAVALYNAAAEELGAVRGIGIYERAGQPAVVRIAPPASRGSSRAHRTLDELPELTRTLIDGAERIARRVLTDADAEVDRFAEEVAQIVRLEAMVLGEEIEDGLITLADDTAALRMLTYRSRSKARTWIESGLADDLRVRTAVSRATTIKDLHPIDAALMFAKTAPDRRTATRAADQRIWDASWAFEKLTGHQGLIYIESAGKGADRYRFGDDGANGSYTALGTDEAERHVMSRLDALRVRDDLPGPLEWDAERCMACRKPVIPGHARFDGSLAPAEETLDGAAAGTQRIALCAEHVDKYHSPAATATTQEAASGAEGIASHEEALFGRVDSTVLREYLAACERADATSMLDVGKTLAAAPLVVSWWYPDNGSSETRRLVRRTRAQLQGGEANLVLIDRDGDISEESFGWEAEPEKVTRHRVHTDGLGVTFYSPQGTPSRTHRILHVPAGTSPRDLLTNTPKQPESGVVNKPAPPVEPPKPGTLWWASTGKRKSDREMVKVAEVYRDADGTPTRISAEVVLPVPPRTTVRFWTIGEVGTQWSDITDKDYAEYEKAWGFDGS